MADFIPYEKTHRLRRLLLTITIVNDGQDEYVLQLLRDQEAALMVVTHGSGTSERFFYQTMGGEAKKHVILAVMREDRWESYKKAIEPRFKVSNISRGVAFSVPIETVFGISTYKMLSNNRLIEKPIKPKKR